MNATTVVVIGPGHGSDRQAAEVSIVNGNIWLTFLGPRGGRQYTLPLSVNGATALGQRLTQAAASIRELSAAVAADELSR
jgi:hypothetical protein